MSASLVRTRRAVLVSFLLFGAGGSAGAQDATSLPEVTVTAAAPPVGDGLDALAARRLGDLQVRTPQDLTGTVPNLVTLGAGERSFNSITASRGMANSLYFVDPAVVYYVDGVPSAIAPTNVFDPHAVDSIRAWRGPQEDRFGQNAPAGTIEVTSDAPQPFFSSTLSGDYGSYDRRDVFGEATAPVPVSGGGLSALASGHYTAQDGILTNPTLNTHPDHTEESSGRFALRYAPAPDWTFDFNFSQTFDDDGAPRLTPLGGPRYQIGSRIDGQIDQETGVAALSVRHQGDEVETTFTSSYRSYDLDPDTIDIGFGGPSNLASITVHQQQYTQELRLASVGQNPVSWQAGAFYQHVDGYDTSDLTALPSGSALTTDFNSYALFGRVTARPLDKFSLTFGNRFQVDDRGARRQITGPAPTSERQQRTWFNLAPKIEAAYDATRSIRFFASSGLAFRPGGYSVFPGNGPVAPHYGAEHTWANEIGVSGQAWDHRVETTFSLFWNQTYNYQLEIYDFPNSAVVNAPEVAARGAEWQIEVRPADALTLRATTGYTLSTFVRFQDTVTGGNDAGLNVPYIPQATWLLEATYRPPFRGGNWVIHTDLRGVSAIDFTAANQPLFRQNAYALWNARIGYETRHWGVYLHGENLADTGYDTLIDQGINAQAPGDPRTVGIEANLKW